MSPPQLPRLSFFPVLAEDNAFYTAFEATVVMPISIRKKFPLKHQPAPDFILTDQQGRQVCLHDTLKLGRPVILFFFPLAGSPYCTRQSCLFQDALEQNSIFDAMQAIVIGISQDPPSKGQKFSELHKLTYPILYDHKRKVMDSYGIGRTTMGLFDTRATFIIDPSGIVRGLAEGVFSAKDHVKFAEKWLIRLEEELSERSKMYFNYVAQEGDMIANMQLKKNEGEDTVTQVVYGERRSSATTIQTVTPDKSEKKNKWKNWKLLFSQLSSSRGTQHNETVIAAAFSAAHTSDPGRQIVNKAIEASVPPERPSLKSSKRSVKDGEKAMMKGIGLAPPPPSIPDNGLVYRNIKLDESPIRPTAKSSLRKVKDGEKAMMKGIGLNPPPPEALTQTGPTNDITPASSMSPASDLVDDEQVWMQPLKSGWKLGEAAMNKAPTSTPPTSYGHNRLGSHSSSVASRITTSSNPLFASISAYSLDYVPEHLHAGVTSEVLLGDALMTNSLSNTTFGGSQQDQQLDTDESNQSNDHSTTSSDLEIPDAPRLQVTEEDLSGPFSDLLKSFPDTPSPLTETKQLELPQSFGLQRSVSYDAYLDQLPRKPSLVPIRSLSLMDHSNEVRYYQRRRSIDSDITVPDKHTSFDHHHHHQKATKMEALQRHISPLFLDMNQGSLFMIVMLLQMCHQQQQDKEEEKKELQHQETTFDLD